jgi:putative membrane protein
LGDRARGRVLDLKLELWEVPRFHERGAVTGGRVAEAAPSPKADQVALALDRTRLAYDRTLMAGVRTALSLITFGFTVYKFFELGGATAPRSQGALDSRAFGILLIAGGLITLSVSLLQYVAGVRDLRRQGAQHTSSMPAWIAGVVSVLGLVALGAAILRH